MLTCCCIILMFIRLSFVHFPLPFPLRLPGCGCSFVRQSPVDIRRILYWPFLHLLCSISWHEQLLHSVSRMPTDYSAKTRQKFSLCENLFEKLPPFFLFFIILYARHQVAPLSSVQFPVLAQPPPCLPFLIDRRLSAVLP